MSILHRGQLQGDFRLFNRQPLCKLLYIASVFTNLQNQTVIIMKLLAKACFARLWIMLLFTSLSMVSVSATSFAVSIGQSYAGGIVFAVYGTGQHGLVAAKEDMRGHSPGMREGAFTWSDAKVACNNLVSNGYSDWYLPGRGELNWLFIFRRALGGFASGVYWSSSDNNANNAHHAWGLGFGDGGQYDRSKKDFEGRVRPVRAF